MGVLHIQQLYTYPIKSLRGISLPTITATSTGFLHDRQFMLWDVTKSETMHIGLRPAMCLFITKFDSPREPNAVEVTYGLEHTYDKPGEPVDNSSLSVPLRPDPSGLEKMEITMHKSCTLAYDMGEPYNEWFTKRFGYAVKLLYIGENRRKVLGNLPPKQVSKVFLPCFPTATGLAFVLLGVYLALSLKSMPTLSTLALGLPILCSLICFLAAKRSQASACHGITFADLAPFLVISATSHQNVQARLPDDEILDITKFRPNVVVAGAAEPFEEDFWSELQIGEDIRMELTQNCARCSSLNVDYATGKIAPGEAGKVLKILSKYRRVDPGTKWSPVFGRYGFLLGTKSTFDVATMTEGDEIRILKRNQERTVMEYPK